MVWFGMAWRGIKSSSMNSALTGVSPGLWVSCCSSSALLPSRSMSSRNRMLQSCRHPVDTYDSGCRLFLPLLLYHLQRSHFPMNSQVSQPTAWSFPENNTRYKGYPCLTHTAVRKKSPAFPFSSSAIVAPSCNDLMTSISRLPTLYSFKTCQTRPSCQTRSNAFWKSTKLW